MIGFPLLIIPFAIYNMIAFLTPGFDWASRPYTFPLKSGVEWGPSFADAFLVFSLLMLMFEMIKSTRHGRSIVEHFLVLLLACGAAAEFVLVKEAANSTFLLFAAICFVDLFAGFAYVRRMVGAWQQRHGLQSAIRRLARCRQELEDLLQSATLRQHADMILADVFDEAVKLVMAETGLERSVFSSTFSSTFVSPRRKNGNLRSPD